MTTLTTRPSSVPQTGNRSFLRPLLVILATAAVLTVNALATILPINGQTTGEISDRFDVYFVPAGYVFSIWGVIYLGLIAYSIYQVRPSLHNDPTLRAIMPWYIVSAVANSSWILAWHYNLFPLSLAIIVVLLLSLIAIYRRLAQDTAPTRGALWALHIPFRIYLAWVSVATIANATSVLSITPWNGFGLSEPLWGAIMIGVATLLGLIFSVARADIAFVAVFVWALAGIAVKQSATPLVAITAGAAAALLALSLLLTVPRRVRALNAYPVMHK